jgi:hypothetical protein
MLIISGSVCSQAPRYFLQSNLEAQQINHSNGTNYTNSFSAGIKFLNRMYGDIGFCYRFRYRPSGMTEFSKLRWTTIKAQLSLDVFKDKNWSPGISIGYQKGLYVIDYEKSVLLDDIRPGYYYTSYPTVGQIDFDRLFLIRKMNYELQSNLYVRYNYKFLTILAYGGILTRKVTLYSTYSDSEITRYPVLLNLGVSLGVFIGKP